MIVEDLSRTVAFYRDVLGFDVVATGPGTSRAPQERPAEWALLACGEARLFVQERSWWEGVLPGVAAGRGRVTVVLEADDLADRLDRVREHGAGVRAVREAGGALLGFSVRDVDGALLVFSAPALRMTRAA